MEIESLRGCDMKGPLLATAVKHILYYCYSAYPASFYTPLSPDGVGYTHHHQYLKKKYEGVSVIGDRRVSPFSFFYFSAIFPHFIAYILDFIEDLIDMGSIFEHFSRSVKRERAGGS